MTDASPFTQDSEMDFHPIAGIFPLLQDDELQALAADIRRHGLLQDVVTYEGKVLDGRNRWLACKLAGVKPRTRRFSGTHQAAIDFVWSENRHRRHLTSSQAAIAEKKREMFVAEYSALVEAAKAEARKRQADAGRKHGAEGGRGNAKPLGNDSPKGSPENSRAETVRARAAGTNRKYLAAAGVILEKAPEAVEKIEKGEKTIPQVMRELRKQEVASKVAALPKGKFRIIYADPPWKYRNSGVISSGSTEAYGRAERHYPTMSIADLCAMDVKSIAADDAVLFLWVTSPLLAECWPVIRAWGFEYKASFVWDKVKQNFGHYNSVRHELLLVCTRGSCLPSEPMAHDSVISVERSGHSAKPERFREIIDSLYPTGSRVELFARVKAKGWTAYGNQLK